MKTKKQHSAKIKSTSLPQFSAAVLIVFGVAITGALLIWRTFAATPVVSNEVETGVIAGTAQALSDASASGKSYVRFGSKTTTTTTSKLAWAPPTLVNPTTVVISNASPKANKLDPTKDYIIRISGDGSTSGPKTPVTTEGGINIYGGHNIVVIGGEVDANTVGASPGQTNRGLYLQNWTGTLHIEGVWVAGSQLGEGIDIGNSNVGAILQLENIRIETVHGTQATNHADIIQNWSGPTTYRIDHLTGSSIYQGFFIQSMQFGPMTDTIDFRNVNLTGTQGAGHYMFYNATGLTTANVSLTNVYSNPQYPGSVPCGCYPETDPIWKAIKPGVPPAGDFVPVGKAGVNYVSPGYQ